MLRVIYLIPEWIFTSHVHVLQACEVEESHSAASFGCKPDAVVRVWGMMEEKLAAYTTENARNIVNVTVYLSTFLATYPLICPHLQHQCHPWIEVGCCIWLIQQVLETCWGHFKL